MARTEFHDELKSLWNNLDQLPISEFTSILRIPHPVYIGAYHQYDNHEVYRIMNFYRLHMEQLDRYGQGGPMIYLQKWVNYDYFSMYSGKKAEALHRVDKLDEAAAWPERYVQIPELVAKKTTHLLYKILRPDGY